MLDWFFQKRKQNTEDEYDCFSKAVIVQEGERVFLIMSYYQSCILSFQFQFPTRNANNFLFLVEWPAHPGYKRGFIRWCSCSLIPQSV